MAENSWFGGFTMANLSENNEKQAEDEDDGFDSFIEAPVEKQPDSKEADNTEQSPYTAGAGIKIEPMQEPENNKDVDTPRKAEAEPNGGILLFDAEALEENNTEEQIEKKTQLPEGNLNKEDVAIKEATLEEPQSQFTDSNEAKESSGEGEELKFGEGNEAIGKGQEAKIETITSSNEEEERSEAKEEAVTLNASLQDKEEQKLTAEHQAMISEDVNALAFETQEVEPKNVDTEKEEPQEVIEKTVEESNAIEEDNNPVEIIKEEERSDTKCEEVTVSNEDTKASKQEGEEVMPQTEEEKIKLDEESDKQAEDKTEQANNENPEEDDFGDFEEATESKPSIDEDAKPELPKKTHQTKTEASTEIAEDTEKKIDNKSPEEEDDFEDFVQPVTLPQEGKKEDSDNDEFDGFQSAAEAPKVPKKPEPVADWTLQSKPNFPIPSSLLGRYNSNEVFLRTVRSEIGKLSTSYRWREEPGDDTSTNISESRGESFLQKMRKPLFDVSAKCIHLNSLHSVSHQERPEAQSKIGKIEYKPAKKVGEAGGQRNSLSEKPSKLDVVEHQILNVLGYIESVWQSSRPFGPQENTPTSPMAIMQVEEEKMPRAQGSIIIPHELAGIDLQSVEVKPKAKKVEQPVRLEEPLKEAKTDPKIIRKNKLVEELIKTIPDYEFLLTESVVNPIANGGT